jgi:hypothetical protein
LWNQTKQRLTANSDFWSIRPLENGWICIVAARAATSQMKAERREPPGVWLGAGK